MDLAETFWVSLAAPGLPLEGIRRAVIIPILIKRFEVSGAMQFLTTFPTDSTGPLGCFPLEAQLSPREWTLQEARQHLVTETILGLRRLYINKANRHAPLRAWEQAVWANHWIRSDSDSYTCIWIPLIVINPKQLVLNPLK